MDKSIPIPAIVSTSLRESCKGAVCFSEKRWYWEPAGNVSQTPRERFEYGVILEGMQIKPLGHKAIQSVYLTH